MAEADGNTQPVAEPPFIKMINAGNLLAIHSRYEGPGAPYIMPSFGVGEAILTATHMRSMDRAEIWRNGRSLGDVLSKMGELQFYDLRHSWRAVLHPPLKQSI